MSLPRLKIESKQSVEEESQLDPLFSYNELSVLNDKLFFNSTVYIDDESLKIFQNAFSYLRNHPLVFRFAGVDFVLKEADQLIQEIAFQPSVESDATPEMIEQREMAFGEECFIVQAEKKLTGIVHPITRNLRVEMAKKTIIKLLNSRASLGLPEEFT